MGAWTTRQSIGVLRKATLDPRTMCQLICKSIHLHSTFLHEHIVSLERNLLCSALAFLFCFLCLLLGLWGSCVGISAPLPLHYSGRSISINKLLTTGGRGKRHRTRSLRRRVCRFFGCSRFVHTSHPTHRRRGSRRSVRPLRGRSMSSRVRHGVVLLTFHPGGGP